MLRLPLLAVLLAHLAAAEELCALTAATPKKPRYLKFCQDYGDKACCIPGHDLENQIQFENLIDGLGPGCKNPMMYPNIRYYYCLGCDPRQPEYTSPSPNDGTDGVVRVCKAFITKMWDDYRDQYLECGVMQWNRCPPELSDFDPYTCGDDFIIPPNEFASGIEFMNRFPPPGMYDFEFVEAVDNETCWQPPFMRSSAGRAASGAASVAIMLAGVALRRLL